MQDLTQQDVARFWERVAVGAHDECWLWTLGRSPKGYGKFKARGQHLRAHRVAKWLADGPFDLALHVLHRCDNPPCCNPRHLWVGTDADNCADKWAKGRGRGAPKGDGNGARTHPERRPRGARNGAATLTEGRVLAIRIMAEATNPPTYRELAASHGVSPATISRIVNRRIWTHV